MSGQARGPKAPKMVDLATPHVARMQDVCLDGKDAFTADREAVRGAHGTNGQRRHTRSRMGTAAADLDPTASALAFFGAELRRVRTSLGMSQIDLAFGDGTPDVLHEDGLAHGHLTADPSTLRDAHRIYDLLRAAALPPGPSTDLIADTLNDLGHDD